MSDQTHDIVATGEGELAIEDISALGLKDYEAVEAALFFIADDVKACYKRIMEFHSRRAIVEGLVKDMDHFRTHCVDPKRSEDSVSIVSFVKAEMFSLSGRIEDLLGVFDDLDAKDAKKISPEGRRASIAISSFHKSIMLGILSAEMTGIPAEDDESEELCLAMASALSSMDHVIVRVSKLRAEWSRRVLRKRSPKLIPRLEAMSAERIRRIAKAKEAFERGEIDRTEAMLPQYSGVELVSKSEVEADIQGPSGDEDA